MRTFILPLAALLAPLAACTVNGPREPAPEPSSPVEPPEPLSTAAPSAPAPQASATVTATTPAPATTARTATTAPGEEALFGTWSSAACGPRKYERRLSLAKDGSFVAEDRVSPCPPNVACVWSGIVHRKGAFKRADSTLLLSVSEGSQGPGAHPFPTTLTLDPSTGALAETGEGGAFCPYAPAGK
ncbi:hypothetical protein predicted by Glimmer/Critica [Sorangium cellulosum So ce56]|uniref:Secreted protein n=1 Tax=Sorangium cellulosum (strain So ce56) TaxID=448385 RepID=A9G685_SORC5|nr:hypothetical protein [Sorangium cellulosum]CAN92663.1 hypothetical protein predicted by Glimmer/Critica [Sorangium cellulosum So ce56]